MAELEIEKNSFNGLLQFFPYAVISGTDTVCGGETGYLTVRLVQGTPPWRFSYSINGKNAGNISNIDDTEYILEAVKEGTYRLTSVRDANRNGIVSGVGEIKLIPLVQS